MRSVQGLSDVLGQAALQQMWCVSWVGGKGSLQPFTPPAEQWRDPNKFFLCDRAVKAISLDEASGHIFSNLPQQPKLKDHCSWLKGSAIYIASTSKHGVHSTPGHPSSPACLTWRGKKNGISPASVVAHCLILLPITTVKGLMVESITSWEAFETFCLAHPKPAVCDHLSFMYYNGIFWVEKNF